MSLGRTRLLALLACATLVPATANSAEVPLKGAAGSVDMKLSLENTHVLKADGTVHALVRLDAKKVNTRKQRPVNMALVIDRSGSMRGDKIEDARNAALAMLDKLRDGDRLAIVSYSSDVRVDVASAVLDRKTRMRMKDAILMISPNGSTFLSGGMTKGHDEVRRHLDSDKVNRVLLISDGIANRGVTNLPGLNRIAREASQEGIVTTTLGLGTDYNEDLMTSVADHGGGNYYYVRESQNLASTLDTEISQMMATVAQRSTLELTVPNGVKVEEVYGYAWQQEGPTVVVRLGDMYAGQKRAVLVKLRTPDETGLQPLGTLTLRYADSAADGRRRDISGKLSVEVTKDRSLVERGRDKVVAARIAEIQLATSMQKAAEMVQAGDHEGARRLLKQASSEAKKRGENLGAAGAALVQEADAAADLSDELEAAPASAAEKKDFVKRSKARSYKAKKR